MSLNKPNIYKILLPFAFLYGMAVRIRNKLFDYNILKSKSFNTPVICVGNISVGGTGKTPHTEYLISLLKDNFNVCVLSRGYKRKTKGFVMAQKGITCIEDIGDEPFQMWTKFPDICVAADADRCNGIDNIEKSNRNSAGNVIILDDAFQHRYVKAGMNILLIDYNRPIHNDAMLPAGRLREPQSGKKRADIIIVSKCPPDITEEKKNELTREIAPSCNQSLFFTYMSYGKLYGIFNKEEKQQDICSSTAILLLTGIASPKAIIKEMNKYTDKIFPLTFSDHHNFDKNDMEKLRQKFMSLAEDEKIIVTTEKDAARLITNPFLPKEIKPYIFALPIKVRFIGNSESMFNHKITEYVRKNSRNSSLYQG